MGNFDEETIQRVWNKGITKEGFSPETRRFE